jgi:hypothetical protein
MKSTVSALSRRLSPNSLAQPFLTNSSATSRDVQQGYQLAKIALNFFDTLVPHFLRSLDSSHPPTAFCSSMCCITWLLRQIRSHWCALVWTG